MRINSSFLLAVWLTTTPWGYAQDAAEPLDLKLLLDQGSENNQAILPHLLKRVTDISCYDLIVVLHGEHLSDARVLGFGGIGTGVVWPPDKRDERAFESCVPHDASKAFGDRHLGYVRSVDRKLHAQLLHLAWELAANAKIGAQYQNLAKSNPGVDACYFVVSSRLFTDQPIHSLIGGYIYNPKKNSKSFEFLEKILRIEAGWKIALLERNENDGIRMMDVHRSQGKGEKGSGQTN